MFWIQTPLAIMAGVSVYLSIPASFSSGDRSKKDEKLSTKLASIDYIGALLLVSPPSVSSNQTNLAKLP